MDILKRLRTLDCKAITTLILASNLKLMCDASLEPVDAMMYHHMIGTLMYLTNTRNDICFAVNTLSQFLKDSRHVHLIAANHVLRYLKGTMDYGLKYDVNKKNNLHDYVYSYWIGSATDRKSTLGCCFGLGSSTIS